MISNRSKLPLPLVLVEVPKDKGQIFKLRSVCHLRISVKRPHQKWVNGPMSPVPTLPPLPEELSGTREMREVLRKP
jgi:hypothetical protein